MSDDYTSDIETGDDDLTRSITRLGDTAEQLSDVLAKVDENQKTLLKLKFDVITLRETTEMDTVRLETATQIAKVRNKTAVLVILIMIAASVFGLVSYTKVRANANEATAATVASFSSANRCQIDFNTKVLFILKERGKLDSQSQSNLTVLLEKIAIPGSSFEQGQTYRREFIAQALVIQAHRDALVFPNGSCK